MEAVIFDMDGTIIDSETHFRDLETETFSRLMPRWKAEDHEKIVGLGLSDLHAFLVEEFALKSTHDEFMDRCRIIALEVYGKRAALTDGFSELLDELTEEKVPVGIATSSPRACLATVLERFSLTGRFGAAVSADDAGEGKPSPAVYLLAAERLAVAPARCAAIEDSRLGVLSASRAGMYCVGLRNGVNDNQDLSKARHEIRNFRELLGGRLRTLFGDGLTPQT